MRPFVVAPHTKNANTSSWKSRRGANSRSVETALRNGFMRGGGAAARARSRRTAGSPISAGEWRRKTIASGITSPTAAITTAPAVQRQQYVVAIHASSGRKMS